RIGVGSPRGQRRVDGRAADPTPQGVADQPANLISLPLAVVAHEPLPPTACSQSGSSCRKALIPRPACEIRCSFSTSANRTWPSPRSPNPTPGETATPAFLSSNFANSSEPIFANGSGTLAHTNIVPLGEGTLHPAAFRPLIRQSRRLR